MEHHLPRIMVAADAEHLSCMLSIYGQLGVIANELNRTMGLTDLLPEVVANQVLPKLGFCRSRAPS